MWAIEDTDVVDGKWEREGIYNRVQDACNGEQECKATLGEIRNKGIDSLIPQELEQWKLQHGSVNWTVLGISTEMKYDGYVMCLQYNQKEQVFLYCNRMHDKKEPNQLFVYLEGLNVIQDKEYGTIFVTSNGSADNYTYLSFCKYYEGKEYCDSYTVMGKVSEDELLKIVQSLK